MNYYPKTSKYKNRKVTVDGITFDSAKEAYRYRDLKLLERAGEISGLQLQVKYELIPTQRGKTRTERAVNYIADFVYQTKGGAQIVEDVKGYRDPASAAYAKFVIKRKLMLQKYGIEIREV